MRIEVIRDEKTIVRATGEIDLSNIAEFDKALSEVATNAPKGFVIDLSDTTYIDSAGVQAIFGVYAKIREADGCLALVIGNIKIKAVLEAVHLEQIPGMSVCEDLNAAKEAISGTAGSAE